MEHLLTKCTLDGEEFVSIKEIKAAEKINISDNEIKTLEHQRQN